MRRVLAVATVMAGLAWAPAAEGAARPDLRVTSLGEPPAQVAPGGRLAVRAGAARRTVVGVWLSRDRRRGKGDLRLRGTLVVKRRGRAATRRFTVPRSASGRFFVIACADPARRVRERSERNNCRSSRRRVQVRRAATPARPATPAQPGIAPATPATPAQPGPVPPAPAPAGGDFPRPASARTVQATLDAGRRVTRSDFFFGTVVATGADGTTYTLDVPIGAFPAPVDLTMTPVTAVSGQPLTDVRAVDIQPHGTVLLKPATLTITPPDGVTLPLDRQTPFHFYGDGSDFHQAPMHLGPGIRLPLTHFSTPGVGLGDAAARAQIAQSVPARTQAQVAQAVGELVRAERERQGAQEGAELSPATADALAGQLAQYYDGVVDPAADAAMTSDAAIERGVAELLGWARQVELLGLSDHEALKAKKATVMQRVLAIFEAAIDRGDAQCQDHKLQAISRLMSYARVMALLGSSLSDRALQIVLGCAKFRVDFTSAITRPEWTRPCCEGDGTDTSSFAYRVKASVPVELNNYMALEGKVPGSLVDDGSASSFVQVMRCTSGGQYRSERRLTGTTAGAFDVVLGMDLRLREPGAAPPPPDYDLEVRRVGSSRFAEEYTTTTQACGGATSGPHVRTEHDWEYLFSRFHIDEFAKPFEDFTVPGGATIGRKTWSRTNDDGVSEHTVLTVVHTPDP